MRNFPGTAFGMCCGKGCGCSGRAVTAPAQLSLQGPPPPSMARKNIPLFLFLPWLLSMAFECWQCQDRDDLEVFFSQTQHPIPAHVGFTCTTLRDFRAAGSFLHSAAGVEGRKALTRQGSGHQKGHGDAVNL